MKKLTILLSLLTMLFVIIPIQLKGQATDAEWVEYSIRTPHVRRYLEVSVNTEYYVSLKGDDQNPGTREKPFRHIQKCADIMQPGDVCYVREGTYREIVRPKNSGQKRFPIYYVAYPGEKVTISGTEPITAKWSRFKGSIYQTKVDLEFEQLFVDGKMMIEARWPNMRFEELWERSTWANAGPGSRYGKIVDKELAKTGIDWTGALATMNLAHQFLTWTRTVNTHSRGSDTFEYNRDLEPRIQGSADKAAPWEDDYYYLSGKLEALDIPTEWFLDTETRTLYLWTPDGKSPATHNVEVKVRDYGFEAKNINEIRLIGFNFFATTFQFENTIHSEVDDCHLLYPTYAREVTETLPEPVKGPSTMMSGSNNTIRNSTLGFTPLGGFIMDGEYNTIENNLIHDISWNGSLSYTAISTRGNGGLWSPSLIKSNTMYNLGSSGINYRGQPYIIEYNHLYDAGLLSHDVSGMQTGGASIAGTIIRYNWVHDCHPELENNGSIGLGIRGDDQTRNMTIHHNVIWNVGLEAIIVKGEFNKVYNNTSFHLKPGCRFGNAIRLDTEPEPYKAWRVDQPLLGEQNAQSLVFNNLVGFLRAEYRGDLPFKNASNVTNNILDYAPELRDPENFDFRPKEGSKLIDGGKVMPGLTDHFEGEAPDVGAYEYGGINWRPGYQPLKALFYRMNMKEVRNTYAD